jgi:hypothetical protein
LLPFDLSPPNVEGRTERQTTNAKRWTLLLQCHPLAEEANGMIIALDATPVSL